jgi:NAD(P)-dependent dehydrogenase (short-subunit alcohol dehydrogenase family)
MSILDFEGRVAVVTGAGQGLGREYATSLAKSGALVLVNDIGYQGGKYTADAVVNEILAAGGIAAASTESVNTPQGGEAIIAQAMDCFGRIDILINNAGIVRDRAFHNLSEDEIKQVLDVHLGGAFWVTKPAFKLMRSAGYGRIIFTTSISGMIGNFGQANYGAAKTAMVGLAKVLAVEGANYGIRANVIAPLAGTEMSELLVAFDMRDFSASDVAAVVIYLAHESCAVNGEIFSAIGGRVARYFIGLTKGIQRSGLKPEDVAQKIEEICQTSGFTEPRTLAEEIIGTVSRINSPG